VSTNEEYGEKRSGAMNNTLITTLKSNYELRYYNICAF
jgi:hypothetical protein